MNIRMNVMAAVALGGLVAATGAQAQIAFAPAEIYGCNYVAGSDYEDFSGAVRSWKRWMDEQNLTAYNGVALQPFYYSNELDVDIIWLGTWASGAAEGEHNAAWIRNGGDVIEGFNEVVSCPSHSRWVAGVLRPFETVPEQGIAEFRNCTIKENRTLGDALAALNEWLEFEAQMDIGTGHLLLLPVAGGASTDDFDFKWVIGFPSYEAQGASADPMIRLGGGNRFNQIIANVMSCDSPRVYITELARLAAE